MFVWVHQACAILQTNQIHTIPPSQSYPTVFINCHKILCKETIKCQKNTFFLLFFFGLAVSCLQILDIYSVIFCSKYSLKMSINKKTRENKQTHNPSQTIKEISAFSWQSCNNSRAPVAATDSFHWNLHVTK